MRGVGHLSPDSRGVPVGRCSTHRCKASRCVAALAMLTAVGCQSTHVVGVREDGAPQYERAKVVYEVSQPQVDLKNESAVELDYVKTHPLKAVVASRQASRARSKLDQEVARLSIAYPHPEGHTDLAHAVVELPEREGVYRQVAATDFDRHELDLLLISLANGGTFDTEQRPAGNARVTVEIDGHSHSRRWTHEPRLDRLAYETLAVSRSASAR